MAIVRYTKHLVRFFPDLANHSELQFPGSNLDGTYPGLAAYIVDEHGALRKHVNIFLDDELIHDRQTLQDPVTENDRLFIFQALSGGAAQLSDHQTSRLLNYPSIQPPNCPTTQLPNYPTIKPLN